MSLRGCGVRRRGDKTPDEGSDDGRDGQVVSWDHVQRSGTERTGEPTTSGVRPGPV